MTSIEGSDLGNVLNSISAVGSVLVSLVAAFVSCLLEVENFKKLLNWAGTIMEKIFEYIGPVINDILAPLVEVLETVGETVGLILTPLLSIVQILMTLTGATLILKILVGILEALGKAFEWLHNTIIVPMGNTIIRIANGIIDALNKIPFVNIKKLDYLNYVGEKAEEIADVVEKALELTRKKFERQKQAVNDLLQSQLDSLKSQFELGLISREEYEEQAEKYASEADEKLYDLEKEMNETLKAIEENTEESFLTGSWDVGTSNQPFDQFGMVHQGEIVVPRTFSDGIRSGELTLSRSSENRQTSSPICVTVNVGGSVLAENELVDTVYNGLVRGMERRRYAPLGA